MKALPNAILTLAYAWCYFAAGWLTCSPFAIWMWVPLVLSVPIAIAEVQTR